MRLRTVLVGLFAIVFGGSAASGVYLLGSRSPKAETESISIVSVTTDVSRGTSLTKDVLHMRPWPKGFVPEGALMRLEDALDRTVWIPLLKDDPVIDSKLAAPGAGQGLAALIPSGMRAVTIQTPDVSTGVAGFILPGNHVDVLLTLSHRGFNDPTGGGSTLTLLQNIEILAVDQRIEAPSENVVDPRELRSVTLLVSPKEAAKLDLGQNKGTLSLTLRNPEDTALASVDPATLAELPSESLGLPYGDVEALAASTPQRASEPDGAPAAAEPESTSTREHSAETTVVLGRPSAAPIRVRVSTSGEDVNHLFGAR